MPKNLPVNKPYIVCEQCQRKFSQYRSSQRFCSNSCRFSWWTANKRMIKIIIDSDNNIINATINGKYVNPKKVEIIRSI
jgi:protein-arginine kinase activator protein McsA